MRQSGKKTKMERSTIMKLLLASSAGPPTSLPMEAKLSPTMIEYASAPHSVLNVTVNAGMMAVDSPKTLAQVSLYESAPTAEPTRAIVENV